VSDEKKDQTGGLPPIQLPPLPQLGALAGNLLARVVGANPRVGAQLGRFAADQELRRKVGAVFTVLADKVAEAAQKAKK